MSSLKNSTGSDIKEEFTLNKKWIHATIVYVLVALFLPTIAQLYTQEPFRWNEYGDWLAGTTAPVAVLWFIIAYRLQMKEMANQVKEMQGMKEAQEDQRDALSAQAELMEKQVDSLVASDKRAVVLHRLQTRPQLSMIIENNNKSFKNTYTGDLELHYESMGILNVKLGSTRDCPFILKSFTNVPRLGKSDYIKCSIESQSEAKSTYSKSMISCYITTRLEKDVFLEIELEQINGKYVGYFNYDSTPALFAKKN